MGAVNTGKPKNQKVDITPELAKQVAESVLDGESTNDLIKAVNLSYPIVKRIMRSPEFTAQVKDIVKNRVATLAGKMVDVLEAQLQEGNLEAVKLGLKVIGAMDTEAEKGSTDQSITIIMPGSQAPQPKTIAVEAIEDAITEDQSSGDQSN